VLRRLAFAVAVLLLPVTVALAHEARPASLEITEVAPGRYDVLWRTPRLAGLPLPVVLRLPEGVRPVTEPVVRELSDTRLERRLIETGAGGLAGQRFEMVGLQATITDVLVRVRLRDGTQTITLVHPTQPWIEIARPRGWVTVAAGYVVAGIHHILLGVDHLLFVLGLLLIVRERGSLVKTVSAFTLAHSITLAIATLGYASVPVPPLNAAIALSILFLGPEIVRAWRGETSFTLRHPWVVAFAFGLLHGFGFASGLTTMGLPRAEIPLALLMFNIGVEVGQLVFVGIIMLMERAFRVLQVRWPRVVEMLPAYAVGSLGAYWTIQRVVLLFAGAR
jgi:hypothetical protein